MENPEIAFTKEDRVLPPIIAAAYSHDTPYNPKITHEIIAKEYTRPLMIIENRLRDRFICESEALIPAISLMTVKSSATSLPGYALENVVIIAAYS